MQFISVKEAASKFSTSERRVQQLCDSGRIPGAQRISGVWIIPSDAPKPADERSTFFEEDNESISLQELCSTLSISVATGRNWLKLGKITPQKEINKNAFFSQEYVSSLKKALENGENSALKSRRNKKYVSGTNMYNSYVSDCSVAPKQVQAIIDYIQSNNVLLREEEISTVLAECATQLILHDTLFASSGKCLYDYLNGTLDLEGYGFLIDDLISDREASLSFIKSNPVLFEIVYQYERNEDILGLLYISTKNLGTRKATGSYYTPTKVVKKLCTELFSGNNAERKKILDPCCGTGNFLLQLPENVKFKYIYGNDIDTLSVKIARINLAVKHSIKDKRLLYEHITNGNYLNFANLNTYDFIIGNPPWGYEYTGEEKSELKKKFNVASGPNIESYDVFIEQAIHNLVPTGVLSFVLPEAILNVKAHSSIRKFILDNCNFQYINFLGNVFDRVQCPCIIFQVQYTGTSGTVTGLKIENCHHSFTINNPRKITEECFSFLSTDEENSILNKMKEMKNVCYLAGNAIFALGIVTGNNKKYVSPVKDDNNEMVLKGSDIYKYRFEPSSNYMTFKPDSFQQVAPTKYYRAPEKLLYRFICNQLVFSYDDHQTLSLNSCNVLIPQIEGLSIKYILAILNSRMAQYFFKKTFNSVKILRTHIEQIPIPAVDQTTQDNIVKFINTLCATSEADVIAKAYEDLDEKIAQLYRLSSQEYMIIKEATANDNLFLFSPKEIE